VECGNLLPADGILIQSNNLEVDEAAITGVSDHVEKTETTDPMLFSGKTVFSGRLYCLPGEYGRFRIAH